MSPPAENVLSSRLLVRPRPGRGRGWLARLVVAATLVAWSGGPEAAAQTTPAEPVLRPLQRPVRINVPDERPGELDDLTPAGLTAEFRAFVGRYGTDRDVPLDAKAEYFQSLLERCCRTEWGGVHTTVTLPKTPGEAWTPRPEHDGSTWNGAYLSALACQYRATRDPRVLARIATHLEGLQVFFLATRQPGLPARCVIKTDAPQDDMPDKYLGPDGKLFRVRSDAAKGTVNQIAIGLAELKVAGYDDLDPEHRAIAKKLAVDMARHLAEREFKLREADGKETTYGDLTPIVATHGVPFNAQVAYLIVSLGRAYAERDDRGRESIEEAFERLRRKHHAYYEEPTRHLILPQKVGASPLLKGMNDRMHVMGAAYAGVHFEVAAYQKVGKPLDLEFVHQLGSTCDWTMSWLQNEANAVANFMWAGLLADPGVKTAILQRDPRATDAQLEHCLNVAIEQLRRYPIDRIVHPGDDVETKEVQWVDAYRPDSYYWKCDPRRVWKRKPGEDKALVAPVDFLHAYWLMRAWKLEEHPAIRAEHRAALTPTLR